MSNKLTQHDIAAMAQEEKYRHQVEMMRKLYTPKGFIDYYFEQLKLPDYKTNIECFNAINDIHYELFGEYKYSSYHSFRSQLSRHLKK